MCGGFFVVVYMKRPLTLSLALLISASLFSDAQAERRYIEFSTGTGFFVSVHGDLVTNHHVIEKCKPGTISIRNSNFDWIAASHKASDEDKDLAILRSSQRTGAVASLDANSSSLRVGENLIVIGYPGNRAHTGEYKFVKSNITHLKGPQGEAKWIQFTDVVAQGNSGGPLLDQTGNVIGVVTGRSEMFRIERNGTQNFVRANGVAVSLSELKNFLRRHRVLSRRSVQNGNRSDRFVERKARDFIVTVRCVISERIE